MQVWASFASTDDKPVSYTHLDVYKRQPYLQSNLFSRNKLILPNTTNIGCGFYFFKNTGKFLGGFYTELADVKNSFEKMKPEEEQNLRTPLKRLSFGIVAKMTIGSFLDIF